MGQLGFEDPLRSFVIVTACGLVTNILSLWAFDKVGRRHIMFYGALVMAAMMLGVGGATANGTENMSRATQSGCVTMLILWFAAYCLSWGPGVWIISGEVGTGQLREHTLFLSTMATFAMSLPINFVNPYVQAAIGGRIALIYGSFSVLSMAFVWFFIPELKGRSLEELDEMFQGKVPTRKFRSYVCTGLGAQIRTLENHETDQDRKEGTITEHVEEKKGPESA
jgi:SP family sugar:H+ symporter-like MFS transporter